MEWNFISALIGVIAGGLITGYFSLKSVDKALEGQKELNKEDQRKIILGVLQAVYEEIYALQNQLNEVAESYWEEFEERRKNGTGAIFSCRLSVSQDYLAIYRSNANLIGQIEPEELRRQIVKVYTALQALIEQYRLNTMLLNECREAVANFKEADFRWKAVINRLKERGVREKEIEVNLKRILHNDIFSELETYAPELKKGHNDFEDLTKELFRMLKEIYGIQSLAKDNP